MALARTMDCRTIGRKWWLPICSLIFRDQFIAKLLKSVNSKAYVAIIGPQSRWHFWKLSIFNYQPFVHFWSKFGYRFELESSLTSFSLHLFAICLNDLHCFIINKCLRWLKAYCQGNKNILSCLLFPNHFHSLPEYKFPWPWWVSPLGILKNVHFGTAVHKKRFWEFALKIRWPVFKSYRSG